jgi:hypothetical protein
MNPTKKIILVGALLATSLASAQEKPASAPTSQPNSASQPANGVFKYGTVNTPENSMFKYGTVVNTPNNNNGTINPALTPEPERERNGLNPVVLYGGAGVFGIAGLVTMGLALSFKSQAKQAATLNATETPSAEQAARVKDLLGSTRTTALLSDISLGLAVGFAGGGYLLSRRAKANEAQK